MKNLTYYDLLMELATLPYPQGTHIDEIVISQDFLKHLNKMGLKDPECKELFNRYNIRVNDMLKIDYYIRVDNVSFTKFK